ncbi:hypothetical protein ACJX0J_009552, partial [Zea mays]
HVGTPVKGSICGSRWIIESISQWTCLFAHFFLEVEFESLHLQPGTKITTPYAFHLPSQ